MVCLWQKDRFGMIVLCLVLSSLFFWQPTAAGAACTKWCNQCGHYLCGCGKCQPPGVPGAPCRGEPHPTGCSCPGHNCPNRGQSNVCLNIGSCATKACTCGGSGCQQTGSCSSCEAMGSSFKCGGTKKACATDGCLGYGCTCQDFCPEGTDPDGPCLSAVACDCDGLDCTCDSYCITVLALSAVGSYARARAGVSVWSARVTHAWRTVARSKAGARLKAEEAPDKSRTS